MDKLHKFIIDKEMVNQVRGYLTLYLKEMALQRVFVEQKDVIGLKEAGEVVTGGFDKMINDFTEKVDKKIINEAQ